MTGYFGEGKVRGVIDRTSLFYFWVFEVIQIILRSTFFTFTKIIICWNGQLSHLLGIHHFYYYFKKSVLLQLGDINNIEKSH